MEVGSGLLGCVSALSSSILFSLAISLADFDRSLFGQFDRDLSIAGRVIVADGPGKTYSSRLVKIDRPLFRIPTLGKPLPRYLDDKMKHKARFES